MAVLERASKLVVFVGALAALTIEVVMIARGWGALLTICAVLFAVSMVAAFLSRRTIALVLAFTYVFPAAILAVHGDYFIYFGVLWMSALAGAIAPDAFRTSWNVAPGWRAPLAGWGLTVVAGAAITAWREVDFYPAIVDWPGYVWSSSGGVAPGAV